jgi:hypothetical protein
MRRCALAVALATVLLVLAAPPTAAAGAQPVGYVPPVDVPIVDGFRPPATRYGPGNRGVDYGTSAGDDVRAAADGTVVFAGRIGPSWHVVVLHDDGLRTSYSFLADATVRRGDDVHQGDVVGIAAGAVHFGARAGDEYLDPTTLFGDGPARVHLVRTELRAPQSEAGERRGVLDSLRGLGGRVTRTVSPAARLVARAGWVPARAALETAAADYHRFDAAMRAAAHVVASPLAHAARSRIRRERVIEDQAGCTPDSTPEPTTPAAGHLLVLVAGRDSSTGHTPLLRIDTGTLGYRRADVVQASYRTGGEPYGAGDTHAPIDTAADALRRQLTDLARAHPGATVDVIAHSQGGLVVRAALSGADAWAPDLPVVANVITIDSPHHGAVPATADALLGTPFGGPAAADMSSASRLIARLDRRGLPAGTRFTSIAASGDLVVDAQLAAVDHATNVLVHAEGLHAHDDVVTLPATHRELALALAGLGPSCRNPRDLADDLVLADAIALADAVGWVADRADHLLHLPAAPGGIGPPG